MYISIFLKILYILFLEKGEEKENSIIDMTEKHRLVAFCMCSKGTKPATQACALTVHPISDLSLCGMVPK